MISPLAYIDPSARLGKNVTVHPFAYIDKNVEIGDGCEIMAHASILSGARLGQNNKVYQELLNTVIVSFVHNRFFHHCCKNSVRNVEGVV